MIIYLVKKHDIIKGIFSIYDHAIDLMETLPDHYVLEVNVQESLNDELEMRVLASNP